MNTNNPLVAGDGQPARLVVRPDDIEVANRAYAAGGMQAALESYARRVELGLATGTATPSGPDVEALTAADNTARQHLAAVHQALRDGSPVDDLHPESDSHQPHDEVTPEVWHQLAQLSSNPRFLLADVFSDAELRARVAALAVAAVRAADTRAALAATEETTGPDGDECSPGCTCRAGWTEPGQ